MMALLRHKMLLGIIGVVLVVGGYVGVKKYQAAHQPPEYELAAVTRGDLVQTVDATGNLQSVDDVDLRYEVPGTVDQVNVQEGQTVKSGTILGTLRLAELDAAVAEAAANLSVKIAGATKEERDYYKAAVDAAEASYEQSKVDAANSVSTAQAAVETAKNNLKLAQGGEQSQIVSNAYQNAVVTLHDTVSKLDDGLTQADNILGIDNVLANDAFKTNLSASDPTKLNTANGIYLQAKTKNAAAHSAILVLTTASPHADIDQAFGVADAALSKMSELLASVGDVLNATPPVGSLLQATLDAKKTTIATTRSTISTQYTAVINQKQAIDDAKNSLSTYTVAYNKAVQDLNDATANASTSVALKNAAYSQALSTYQGKINPPREVDLAPLRAALAQAEANREKAIIRAPFDGIVTKISKKVGETVSVADSIMTMLSPHFEIEVDVPETDVAKLTSGDGNSVQFTVDAFGEDQKFAGKVISIEKKSTQIQDVVYYQVKIAVAPEYDSVPFKSGMTANVVIHTADRHNVLYIPLRSVRTNDDGSKYVRILENGSEKQTTVQLGLKANNNLVEVLSGLQEGQQVIISVKQPK